MKKRKKTQKKYYCKKCDFTSKNKTDFNRHLSTTKHKMVTNGNSNGNSKPNFVDFSCLESSNAFGTFQKVADAKKSVCDAQSTLLKKSSCCWI